MVDFEGELVRLLRDFTAKVAVIVRQHALQSARAALGASAEESTAGDGGRHRGRSTVPKNPRARKREATTAKEPFDTEAAGPQVVSFLLANPGLRMDELAMRLHLPTSGLKPLVKKLVASRMLRAEGNTRGRRYFPSRRATSASETRTAKKPRAANATRRRGGHGTTK
jgi:hypothetical protein